MSTDVRAGRPRASSRETLAEAACELFLEQGYAATSIAHITQRAGVSRSSFFNYFSSKSDVLWSGMDARIDRAVALLEDMGPDPAGKGVRDALLGVLNAFEPDPLVLAMRDAEAMGVAEELARDGAQRQGRLAAAVSAVAVATGADVVAADILGAAHAAAVVSSVRAWSRGQAGQRSAQATLAAALDFVAALAWPG